MPRAFANMLMKVALPGLLVASGCGKTGGAAGPSSSPSVAISPQGSSAPPLEVSSAGSTIAARARQDLLESLSLGQASDPPATPAAATTRQPEAVITWSAGNGPVVTPPVPSPPSAPDILPSPVPDPPPVPRTIASLREELATALYERSRTDPAPLRDLTVLAALTMLDGNRALEPEVLETLGPDERLAIGALQEWFLSLDGQLDDREAVLRTLSEAVAGLQASLQPSPTFGLAESKLATRVGGYGDIDEWTLRTNADHYNFIAHAGQEIILYLELEGFDSRLDDTGNWSTATSQELTIYSDRDGIPVWKEAWRTANDEAASRRKDYFTVQKMRIPTNLSVGKYLLKVRVRDEHSRSESETTIPFVMTAAAMTP